MQNVSDYLNLDVRDRSNVTLQIQTGDITVQILNVNEPRSFRKMTIDCNKFAYFITNQVTAEVKVMRVHMSDSSHEFAVLKVDVLYFML